MTKAKAKEEEHTMKKNIFEKFYQEIEEAKKAYLAAETRDEMNAASARYQVAMSKLVGLSEAEKTLWRAYEVSRDRGNERLDIKDCADNQEGVEDLVACMRNLGFTEFTFSSTWSGAVETAWLFQKAGCTLAGLVEIDGPKNFEKAHGYLFRVN